MIRHVLFFLLASLLSYSFAQTLRLGAVLPLTGEHAQLGRAQREALELAQRYLGGRGVALELLVADDGSDPARADETAERLAAQGVHVLLCCNEQEALESVQEVARDTEVPTLTFTAPVPQGALGYWMFSLVPDTKQKVWRTVQGASAEGAFTLGLMASDTNVGDAAKGALERLLSPETPRMVTEVRFAETAQALTPEALWVATRQPEAVLVWGGVKGTLTAVEALRRRGYEGDIYLDADVLTGLSAFSRAKLVGSLSAVSPIVLGHTLPSAHPSAQEVTRYRRAAALSGLNRPSEGGASAWDAALLLVTAFEQALAYGLPTDDPATVRQTLRDALIGLEPVAGASAVFDFNEAEHFGVQAGSLVIARLERGGRYTEP